MLFILPYFPHLATQSTIGSLEFGTLVLGAKVLIVIGHQDCGAVISTMKQAEVPSSKRPEPSYSELKQSDGIRLLVRLIYEGMQE